MVEVGQQGVKLNEAGKKKVDAKVSMAFGNTPQDLFKAFSEDQQFYARKMPTWGKPSRILTSSPSKRYLTF